MNKICLALGFLILGAAPASAEPISAAIAAVGTWFAGLSVVGQALVRLAVGLILSKLAQAKLETPEQPSGLKTEATLTGGDNSEGFILGRYATGGVFVAPPLSFGADRRNLVYVIDLGGLPGQTVNRIFVNGEPQEWETEPDSKGRGYRNTGGAYHARIWNLLFDGTQTEASAYLIEYLGADPDFPWTADMIGAGRPYAVMTFFMDKDGKGKFSGLPTVRFEVDGIPLYDPRKDGTAGGFGAHRWDDPSTWEQTDNPIVMVYNIKRGIALPNGSIWGGGAAAEDLPLDVWAAAMNECDVPVTLADETTEPQYRAGTEVRVAVDEPASVIEDLLAACSGEVVEEGGVWFVQVGAPALPSYFLTDGDVIRSADEELDPFPGLSQTVNGVAITYPEPAMSWETKDAPAILRADLELEDDGRRLLESLDLPACPYAVQVQRLAKGFVEDARRFRVHRLTLPPDAAHVPPLATVSWTSARNGYAAKVFEIQKKQVQLRTLLTQVAIRERDPGDADWSAADQQAYAIPSVTVTTPAAYVLPGVEVTAAAISDGASDRRPAVQAVWDATEADAVEYEVRLSGGAVVAQGSAAAEAGLLVVSDGILPATAYEVRLRASGEGLFDWSDWLAVTTLDLRLAAADLAAELSDKIEEAFARHDAALEDATGTLAELRDKAIAAFGPLDRPEALADEIPRLEAGLEEAYQRLMGLEWSQFTTGQTLAGAGIFVDSDTGEVRIAAFERAEARVSSVEINLAAAEAALELKASTAYVNQAVAEAVLDPSQLPVFDDLQAQITGAELALDAAEGQISALTDSLTVEGGLVTMTTVTQTLDSLQGQISDRVSTVEFEGLEDRVSTAESGLSAIGDTAAVSDAVEVTRRLYDDAAEDDQRKIADLWSRWKGDSAAREARAQARRDLTASVDAGLAAEAAERLQLAAEIEAAETVARAQIEELGAAKVDAAGAVAAVETVISAEYPSLGDLASAASGAAAWISETGSAKVDAAGAVTAVETVISAEYPSLGDLASAASAAVGWITETGSAKVDAAGAVTAVETVISAEYPSLGDLASAASGAAAWISETGSAKVDAAGAVTAVETVISAEYGGLAAMAEATAFAKASADGISAGYVWRVNGESLLELVSVADGTTGPVSTFKIAADYVQISGLAQFETAVLDALFAQEIVAERLTVTGELIAPGVISSQNRLEIGPATLNAYSASGFDFFGVTVPDGYGARISITATLAGSADFGAGTLVDGHAEIKVTGGAGVGVGRPVWIPIVADDGYRNSGSAFSIVDGPLTDFDFNVQISNNSNHRITVEAEFCVEIIKL